MPPISLDVSLICLNYARTEIKHHRRKTCFEWRFYTTFHMAAARTIPIHPRGDCYDAATYQTDSRSSMYCKFTKKEFRYRREKTQPALHLSKKNSDFSLPITCYFYFDCYTGHEAPGQSHHTVRSTLFLKCYSRTRFGRSHYAT
jgi:hypothetical protein